MTQENKQAEQGDAKALLAMRKLMGAVNAYEKATGIGGWYAEEVQTWVNSLARHLGIDVAFGCGAEYPVSSAPSAQAPQPEAQPTLCERICTAIREADSKSVDEAGYMLDSNDCIRIVREQFAAPSAQAPQPEAQPHADDIAVDAFAEAMKQKLAAARDKGRHGWQECSQADLTEMLHEHVAKGDPRDVANFCMFLWSLGYGIKPLSGRSYTESMAFAEGFQAGYERAAPSAQAEPAACPHTGQCHPGFCPCSDARRTEQGGRHG